MSERDKFLTEAMGGIWHERDFRGDFEYCATCDSRALVDYPWPNCGFDGREDHTNYLDASTWQGFGKLWEWAHRQLWWCGYCHERNNQTTVNDLYMKCYCEDVHPDRFATAVYEFLKDRN